MSSIFDHFLFLLNQLVPIDSTSFDWVCLNIIILVRDVRTVERRSVHRTLFPWMLHVTYQSFMTIVV